MPTYLQNGQAFTYKAVSKNGTRPIVYSATGGHANYAVPGIHSRSVATVVINDTTSAGPLWDPILSAYYYTYTPSSPLNGTFTGSDSSTPVSWLYFLGRWGDDQYPDSDPRQVNFLDLNIAWKYETGPTGPLDKDLNRTEVCPDNGYTCTTLSVLPAVTGSSGVATTTGSATASSTAPANINAGSTDGTRSLEVGLGMAGIVVVVAAIL